MNHYQWLDQHLPTFFKHVGINWDMNAGIISAHGDKGYSYKSNWEDADIPFYFGMALYLMTYCNPYSKECRETENGWVDPGDWVINNYSRYKNYLIEL